MGPPVLLFVAALAVRLACGLLFGGPGYLDSFYYVDVAQQLAAGHGLNVPFIWSFIEVGGHIPADPVLPVPSNAHWMPLASLVQVPFIGLFGATPFASALPFWVAGAAAAPLTWFIGRDAGLARWQCLAAGVMVAVPGALTPFLAQPDNFGLYLLLGALALWLCSLGLRGRRAAFVLGGFVVGLASLSRNDGVLLGVPFALAFLLERWRAWRSGGLTGPAGGKAGGLFGRGGSIGWAAAIGCLACFLIVMVPWYARQLAVFGALLPSAATGRVLWITDYSQLFGVTGDPSLASFLAQGLGPLLASRALGFVAAVGLFAYLPFALVLAPFVAIGTWLRRRDLAFAPWLTYGLTLLAFSAALFALHVPSGNFMHSAVALLPHAYLVLTLGIVAAVASVARRRSHWDVPRASRVFTGLAVGVLLVFAALATSSTSHTWQTLADSRVPIERALAPLPDADRLMSGDPAGWWYATGRWGVMTPADPLLTVEEAARAYDIRWLVLERAQVVPSLSPVLAGTVRPTWLSAPLVTVTGPVADAPPGAASEGPTAALYAVCLNPGDTRCGP
ncbi:MAG: glycosyltransferase family 39 protein [Candidatus Limnocylindrales bacterium]